MKRLATVTVIVLFSLGCQEPGTSPSPELLNFSVFKVVTATPEEDPFSGVAYLRLVVTENSSANGGTAQTLAKKVVQYGPGALKSFEDIPFGTDLQLTVEGWSAAVDGQLGQLISRGRSLYFDLRADSAALQLSVPVARVNRFAYTSTIGGAGVAEATSMGTGRVGHTVTLLRSGGVLIAGGAQLVAGTNGDYTGPSDVSAVLPSVELYDPSQGLFLQGSNIQLTTPRAFHTATELADGRVLFAGGIVDTAGTTNGTLEVFDPMTGSFTQVPGVTLATSRAGHTATRLDNTDHLLFAGGFSTQAGSSAAIGTIEVVCVPGSDCEATSGAGSVYTNNLSGPRYFHTATKTTVGLGATATDAVVLIGGENDSAVLSTAETFVLNPAEVRLQTIEMLGGPRTRHTANFVDSQQFIHIVGGFSEKTHQTAVQRIDSYQVQQEAFQTGQEFYSITARGAHAAVNMPNNAVLVIGGFSEGQPLDSAEVIFEYYDETSQQTFIDRGGVNAMHGPRGGCEGILLPNQTVLVVGGAGLNREMIVAGEFFNPL